MFSVVEYQSQITLKALQDFFKIEIKENHNVDVGLSTLPNLIFFLFQFNHWLTFLSKKKNVAMTQPICTHQLHTLVPHRKGQSALGQQQTNSFWVIHR